MGEPITPGMPPRPMGALTDPPRALGMQGQELAAMARRVESLERLLAGYTEEEIVFVNADGDQQRATVLRKGGGLNPGNNNLGASISPKSFSQKNGNWIVVFHPALFYEFSLLGAGQRHEISTSGGNLSDEPEISLPGGESKVWLQWSLDPQGRVNSPQMNLGGSDPSASPMEPERPSGGGVTGTIVQQVGTIVLEEGKAPRWLPGCTDASSHCYVVGIENAGDGVPLFLSYGSGKDRFRTIKQLDGKGLAVCNTEPTSEGDTVDFIRISETSIDSPQIKVAKSGNTIEIRGNGVEVTLADARRVNLMARDGLVVSGSDTGPLPGFNGTLHYAVVDDAAASEVASAVFTMYFEDGRVTLISTDGEATDEGAFREVCTINHPETSEGA